MPGLRDEGRFVQHARVLVVREEPVRHNCARLHHHLGKRVDKGALAACVHTGAHMESRNPPSDRGEEDARFARAGSKGRRAGDSCTPGAAANSSMSVTAESSAAMTRIRGAVAARAFGPDGAELDMYTTCTIVSATLTPCEATNPDVSY